MKKTRCKIIGKNGNIFNLIGFAKRALEADNRAVEAEEMKERMLNAKSYEEALCIMYEYIEVY